MLQQIERIILQFDKKENMRVKTSQSIPAKGLNLKNLVKVFFGRCPILLLPALEAAGETEQRSLRLSNLPPLHFNFLTVTAGDGHLQHI